VESRRRRSARIPDPHAVAAFDEHRLGDAVRRAQLRELALRCRTVVDRSFDRRARFRGRRLRDEATVLDHGEARAEDRDVLDDVRRQQHDAPLGELREDVVETQPFLGIESRRRFVDDDQPRIAGDRLRDPEALAHPARVALDLALRGEREVHAPEQLVAEFLDAARSTHALQSQEVREHRASGQVRIEAEVLREIAEFLPHALGVRDDVLSVERDAPRRRLEQSREDPHERRLARAVRTEQTEHARRDVEIDPLERGDGAGIDLDQVAKDEHGVIRMKIGTLGLGSEDRGAPYAGPNE
jgi:hypothetical protein